MRRILLVCVLIGLFVTSVATAFAQDDSQFNALWASSASARLPLDAALLEQFVTRFASPDHESIAALVRPTYIQMARNCTSGTMWVETREANFMNPSVARFQCGSQPALELPVSRTAQATVTATATAGTPQPSATANAGEIRFTIAGNVGESGFTVSGLTVGATYHATFTGSVVFGPAAGSGTPDGLNLIARTYNYDRRYTHGMVLWVGQDGTYQPCGAECDVVADAQGRVKFVINDNQPQNNSGSFNGVLTPSTATATATTTPIVSAPVATATATPTAISGTIPFSLAANAGEQGYTVSGLTAGGTYRVTFTGEVELNNQSSWRSGPNGRPDTANPRRYNLDPSITHGSVMIVTATGYAPCGAECTFTAGANGSVTFVVNDAVYGNNEGAFSGVIVPVN